MARKSGFIVTIKAFVPTPKNDFQAQANAASLMHSLTATKALTEDFLKVAEVIDVSARVGSVGDGEEAASATP